jgi:serine phosphatase RsbU (regulator of sigma subunit)
MAHLIIRKGANLGQRLPLAKDTIILGRSPDCDIPIPSPSISRQHARLLFVQDRWYIEDMLSRNGTFVNGQAIATRTELKKNDRIRICDFEAIFNDSISAPSLPPNMATAVAEAEAEEVQSSSTLTSIATHGSKVFESQPLENLRLILQIGNRLSTTLELDQLLPKIADNLLQVFKQADRCFVVFQDETNGNLIQEFIRTRNPDDERSARFSRNLVRQCLDTQQAFLSEDLMRDKRAFSQTIADARMRSVMCAPFCTTDDYSIGAIQLDTLDQAKRFTAQDLKLLTGLANQSAIALQNARLYQEMQEREQVERDLELAAQVQRSILPERLPQFPGYQFFTYYSSALAVGGDYFDFIPLPQQRLAITLGDVAGKSVPAAILMAKLSSDVRSCLLTETEPATAITKLNSMLYRNLRQTDRLVTLAVTVLDIASHSVTLVNAGHCIPLLYRHSEGKLKEAVVTELGGAPLGVVECPGYASSQVELNPGDSLLLFTDGVPDARNAADRPFRVQGILNAVQSPGPHNPQVLGDLIVKAVERHAAGRSQYDDITLLTFGRLV